MLIYAEKREIVKTPKRLKIKSSKGKSKAMALLREKKAKSAVPEIPSPYPIKADKSA